MDERGLIEGHLCLNSLPSMSEKSGLTEVFTVDQRELKALDDFIAYKDTLIIRGSVNLYRNMKVADDLREFKKYLEEFPKSNKDAFYELSFWPDEVQNDNADGAVIRDAEEAPTNSSTIPNTNTNTEENIVVDLIMATMPNVERRGYFGPHKEKPPPEPSQRLTRRKKRASTSRAILEVVHNEDGDCFLPYNLETNVMVGQFVALTMEFSEIQGEISFYIGKVIEFGQGRWSAKMKVLWYWPTVRRGAQEEGGSNRGRYANCMEATWKPSGEKPT